MVVRVDKHVELAAVATGQPIEEEHGRIGKLGVDGRQRLGARQPANRAPAGGKISDVAAAKA